MSLDDKLKEILHFCAGNTDNKSLYIPQIKQAFADEGYTKLPKWSGVTLMTGQEWYDRFYKEINSIPYSPLRIHEIWDAAKKAAGL